MNYKQSMLKNAEFSFLMQLEYFLGKKKDIYGNFSLAQGKNMVSRIL